MTRMPYVVGLFCFAAGLLSADDTYQLKLERTSKVGDKFVVAGSVMHSQAQKVTQGGVPQEQKNFGSMTFEGAVEVLEVDADGKVAKASCVVSVCQMTSEEGGEMKETLAKGTVLTQSFLDGGKAITSDKGEIAPEVIDLLNDFLPCDSKDKGADLDQTFGTADPKKVGDTWEINGAKVAESLGKEMGAQIDPKNVKGTVKLAEVADHDGVSCTILHVDMQIAGVVPPGMENAEIKKADMGVKLGVAMPVDASLRQAGEAMELKYDIQASMNDPNAGAIELEIAVHNTKEVEYHPAK